MKTLFTPNSTVKKITIVGLAFAVVIGMSYFSSGNYLSQSIMNMLMGSSSSYTCDGPDIGECPGGGCPGKNNTRNCSGCHSELCSSDGGCNCTNVFCSNHTGTKDYECGASGG